MFCVFVDLFMGDPLSGLCYVIVLVGLGLWFARGRLGFRVLWFCVIYACCFGVWIVL